MNAKRLLYAIGDIRGDFIREAAPETAAPRRRRWPWAAALAACLCLMLLTVRIRPFPPDGRDPAPGDMPPADSEAPPDPGVSGGETPSAGCPLFPGDISRPLLYWQGTAYAWDLAGAPGRPAGEPPETIGQWTELGPLAGVTAEETSEDLWLYADIGQASGTVYADPEDHPGGTLYANPGYEGTVYVEYQKVWSGGSYPLYAPATLRSPPRP